MRTISHFVKSLLVLFGILVVFVAIDILPTLADQFVGMDAALLPLKQPVLFLSEGLLFLLLLGLGVIFYMLLLFDRRAYFTRSFSGSLTILIILCILADGLSLFLLAFSISMGDRDRLHRCFSWGLFLSSPYLPWFSSFSDRSSFGESLFRMKTN